eukprot:8992125-Prorocentrum_lima.AAC.1
MTSSLVGSEMCIRDSLAQGGGQLSHFCKWGSFGASSRAARSWSSATSNACRLYTSDAADDM